MQAISMRIGYDAKRAFHNSTGLGNFSRTLISNMSRLYPEHEYFLFNPKPSSRYQLKAPNLHEVLPKALHHRLLSSIWRSRWVAGDINRHHIDLYHGLSHEIPSGIRRTGVKSIVTIHDLIFLRYPEQYNPIDIRIYTQKVRYACRHSDHIIAISQQTKDDIIHYFGTSPDKITVCHISCDPSFFRKIDAAEKSSIKKAIGLPENYLLYVGSIIERKNLLSVCKAIKLAGHELSLPLVVIGSGKEYKKKVQQFISENGMNDQVIFLNDIPASNNNANLRSGAWMPAIYQGATAFIYPSLFEGFGIPVLESMWSGTPVITSGISSMPEVGGDSACYVNPMNPLEIAQSLKKILTDRLFAESLSVKGLAQARKFTPEICTATVMDVYKKIC